MGRGRKSLPLSKRKTLTAEMKTNLRAAKQELLDKGISRKDINKILTQKNYLKFLQATEKANKKILRAKKKNKALRDIPLFGTKLGKAKNLDQLKRWIEKPTAAAARKKKGVPSLEDNLMYDLKKNFIDNVQKAFGCSISLNDLTNEKLNKLVSDNPVLNRLLDYATEEVAKVTFDLIDMSLDALLRQLDLKP